VNLAERMPAAGAHDERRPRYAGRRPL
jgi:hypothetical protein